MVSQEELEREMMKRGLYDINHPFVILATSKGEREALENYNRQHGTDFLTVGQATQHAYERQEKMRNRRRFT